MDDSTRRVYRLYDFTKSRIITPGEHYCVSGKVNSADKLYLVIESVKPDTNTRALPRLLFLLTAREGGLWADPLKQGINSLLLVATLAAGADVCLRINHRRLAPAYPAESGSFLSRR